MASYDIIFKPSVEKDLRVLPRPVITRVMQRIEALRNDPFPRQSSKLTGAEQLYRMRVGDYRVIYGVDTEAKRITVQYVRHRREAYRNL
jgi:mRNA interferase RelE/StbE